MSQCTCLPYQDGGPCDSCQKESKIYNLELEVASLKQQIQDLKNQVDSL